MAVDYAALRDSYAAILAAELARVAALVAAGHPPPATYTSGSQSVDWNAWHDSMVDKIERYTKLAAQAAAATCDLSLRAYS